jgi:hypothetical protein
MVLGVVAPLQCYAFSPEDGGRIFHRNVCIKPEHCTAQQPTDFFHYFVQCAVKILNSTLPYFWQSIFLFHLLTVCLLNDAAALQMSWKLE